MSTVEITEKLNSSALIVKYGERFQSKVLPSNKGLMVVLTFFNLYFPRTVRKVHRCTPLIKRVLAFYLPSSRSQTTPPPPPPLTLTQRKKFYCWNTIASQVPSLPPPLPLHPPPLPTPYNGFWVSNFRFSDFRFLIPDF